MAAFYLDEGTPEALAHILAESGHNVTTTTQAGRKGTKDYEQLWLAANQGWIILTLDREDDTLLHGAWQHWGVARPHAGILILHQMTKDELAKIARDIDSLVKNTEEFFAWQALAGGPSPTAHPGSTVTNHIYRRWKSGRWDCLG
jgi:predicted nuclease of predicted toxin-antitoxin system